jgi:hypothetical protein
MKCPFISLTSLTSIIEETEKEVHMRHIVRGLNSNRRWFMKALAAAGVASVGASLLAGDNDKGNGKLSKGDAAMLRFAGAAEIL